MTDDLEGVGNSGREDAQVKNLKTGIPNLTDCGGLEEKSRDQGDEACNSELDTGQLNTVNLWGKIVHSQDMKRKSDRTAEGNDIALIDGKTFFYTEKVQTDHGKKDSKDYRFAGFPSEEETKDCDEDNIEGRDETGFSGSRILETNLLKSRTDKHQNSADQPADQKVFPFCRLVFGFSGRQVRRIRQKFFSHSVHKKDDGNQNKHAKEKAARIEKIGADTAGTLALSNECGAPDQSCGKKQNRTFIVFAFHNRPLKSALASCKSTRRD